MSSERTGMQRRHGEILAEVADLCLSLARKLHERAMAAEADDEVQAAAGAFHRITRSLRQTLALEARLERDQRREAVEAARLDAEERRARVGARKAHLSSVGSRLIWTEAERGEVGQLLVDLKSWCDEAAFHEDAFLAGPVEAVIERLRRDLGLPAPPAGDGAPAEPGRGLSNPSAIRPTPAAPPDNDGARSSPLTPAKAGVQLKPADAPDGSGFRPAPVSPPPWDEPSLDDDGWSGPTPYRSSA